MKEVFISYSTKDMAQAETVRDVLEKNGISCWMAPQDIPGGSNYTKEIPNAIRGCKIFVLILSGNAQNSPWVLRELDSAVNSGKVILPFMLEDCALNDEFNFLLTGAQRYAAYQKKAEALEKLVGRVKGVLGAEGQKGADQPPASGAQPAQEQWNNAAQPKTDWKAQAPVNNTPPGNNAYKWGNAQAKQASRDATPTDVFVAFCPACGSADVQPAPKKLVCMDGKERLMVASTWLLGFFFGWPIVMFVTVGVLMIFSEVMAEIGVFVSIPVTVILAKRILTKAIQNKRLRMRKKVESCRCARCGKVFNDVKEL